MVVCVGKCRGKETFSAFPRPSSYRSHESCRGKRKWNGTKAGCETDEEPKGQETKVERERLLCTIIINYFNWILMLSICNLADWLIRLLFIHLRWVPEMANDDGVSHPPPAGCEICTGIGLRYVCRRKSFRFNKAVTTQVNGDALKSKSAKWISLPLRNHLKYEGLVADRMPRLWNGHSNLTSLRSRL